MKTDIKAYFYNNWKAVPKEFEHYLNPEKVAIVEIDMTRSHLHDGLDCPCPCVRGREIVDGVNKFNAAARDLAIPVIHVQCKLRADGCDDAKGNPAAFRLLMPHTVPGGMPNAASHALAGTPWADLMVEVDPKDYIVDTKKRLSAFHPTDLEFLLRELRKETIVIIGLMSDCCDLCAGFEATNRNINVIYAHDLARGFSPELEEASRKIFSLYLGLVVDSKALVEEWRARK